MAFQKQQFNARLVNDLKKRSTSGVFFYMLIPPLIFLTDDFFKRHQEFSLGFLGIFFCICLFRLVHVYVSKNMPKRFEPLNTGVFIGSVVFTALAWGMGSAYFMLHSREELLQTLMLICTVGFVAGGVLSFMPLLYLAVVYNLLMLLPSITAVFIRAEIPTLGFAMILYAVYLILITLRGNAEYWKALENEHLLEEKSSELKKASRTDVLTGLYNRRYFDELFELEWGLSRRRKTPLTLLICDIDYFKQVNDTYGHQAGDAYLTLISRCLKEVFRRETDVAARYGGEEFVVLLPDRDAEQTRHLAERFRKKIAETVLEYRGKEIQTTISTGISSCIPGSAMTRDAFLTRADNVLYEAKNSGRNRTVVDAPGYS